MGGILSATGIDHTTVEGRADFCRANIVDDLDLKSTGFNALISAGEAGARGAVSAEGTLDGREQMPEPPNYGFEGFVSSMVSACVDASLFSPAEVKIVIGSPFIFLIRDMNRGVILFLGRVLDP